MLVSLSPLSPYIYRVTSSEEVTSPLGQAAPSCVLCVVCVCVGFSNLIELVVVLSLWVWSGPAIAG